MRLCRLPYGLAYEARFSGSHSVLRCRDVVTDGAGAPVPAQIATYRQSRMLSKSEILKVRFNVGTQVSAAPYQLMIVRQTVVRVKSCK